MLPQSAAQPEAMPSGPMLLPSNGIPGLTASPMGGSKPAVTGRQENFNQGSGGLLNGIGKVMKGMTGSAEEGAGEAGAGGVAADVAEVAA